MSLVTDIIIKYWPVFPAVFVAGVVDAIAGGGGLISLPTYMLAGLPRIWYHWCLHHKTKIAFTEQGRKQQKIERGDLFFNCLNIVGMPDDAVKIFNIN